MRAAAVDRILIRVFIVALLAACSPNQVGPVSAVGSGSADAASPAVVLNGDGARAHRGKPVAVKGTARDAKIAAAVMADDLVVYCLGLQYWPSGMSGKPVVARGTLEQTEEFTAKVGPRGEISAGTDGPVWVLRGCRYDSR